MTRILTSGECNARRSASCQSVTGTQTEDFVDDVVLTDELSEFGGSTAASAPGSEDRCST